MAKEKLIPILTAVFALSYAQNGTRPPKEGWVPDQETAIAIGVAVAKRAFGEDLVMSEAPFTSSLERGTWVVTGTLPKPGAEDKDGNVVLFVKGGTFEVHLRRSDGKIVKVTHGV